MDSEINLGGLSEFELAAIHQQALLEQSYETCQRVQQEVDRRIAGGTINRMAVIARFAKISNGKLDHSAANGLFDKLFQKK